jgi:hypothetical protein
VYTEGNDFRGVLARSAGIAASRPYLILNKTFKAADNLRSDGYSSAYSSKERHASMSLNLQIRKEKTT